MTHVLPFVTIDTDSDPWMDNLSVFFFFFFFFFFFYVRAYVGINSMKLKQMAWP